MTDHRHQRAMNENLIIYLNTQDSNDDTTTKVEAGDKGLGRSSARGSLGRASDDLFVELIVINNELQRAIVNARQARSRVV